ncbi:hypothetical protein GAY29_21075, partial [Azospirillum brasilense]|uniref:DUF7666 domain-containing protein n=1 Tax=Azospirillum brasilense TaxID=192 RepID=UPI00403F2576|nr:hypothetical protein [Azospirillum brasilense]
MSDATTETTPNDAAATPDATPEVAPPETTPAFKGFDADLKCRGFQYQIGQTYEHSGKPVRCTSGGFHACEMPLDTWNYYGPATSRFATVQLGGQIDRAADSEDSKVAAGRITIEAEIKLPDVIRRAVAWVVERAKENIGTGNYGHAAATGNYGHAAATGYRGHAAATGYRGHAAATGNYGHAAATGYRGHAAATGYRGHAAATGNYGHAAATGDSGHAAAT